MTNGNELALDLGPGNVPPTELKRIETYFFCHHVHHSFGCRVSLRRTIASISSPVAMVRTGAAGKTQHVRDIIGEVHEAGYTRDNIVTQFVVSAVIHTAVPFRCDDFAIFVAGKAGIGICGRALAAVSHVFRPRHGESDRDFVAGNAGDGSQRIGRSGDAPAESRAGRILYNTHLFGRYPSRFGNVTDIRINALRLIEPLTYLPHQNKPEPCLLDRHMRLTGIEAALYNIRGRFEQLGGMYPAP